MLEAGKLLQDRYRIKKQIGQGGMGAVYIATDERFGSTVAIKETFFSDANYSKAFEREARLLNNLRHPALPRVSDFFSDENGQFLVMEYITGEDLSEMLEKREGAFPLNDVLNWADQLLDALDFLHTQEMPVIHRDIKPQNLKLTPRGQIILLDFGLAKGNPTDAQHNTAAKSVFGYSRNYASLEQMQGTGTDPRSDLYSLGATLYHLITGIPPIDALTRAMQVLSGDKDPLKPANELHPQIPIGISEVLQRALDLNANFRPSSAVAMRTMLAESENLEISDVSASPIKKPATGLLTQNTQVFDSIPNSRDTQAGANQTDIQPLAVQSDIAKVETDSVVTRFEPKKQNIQIPVGGETATEVRANSGNTQSQNTGKGKTMAATALGTLLLVGTALGGLYAFKPDIFSGSVSNINTQQSANNNTTLANTINVDSNANNSAIAINNSNVSEPLSNKKAEKVVTAKTSTQPKDENKESTVAQENPPEKEAKVIIEDKEGNQVLEDGTVKAKDGTIVTREGKVIRNGVVIANPNVRIRPMPPNVEMPPIPREELEKLTPEQRKKIRQVMENQRRIMNEQRRQAERNNPPPAPNRTPPN
ncbi:MAG: protein kinase [Pyrinomonadaceae bacterium]|nr:protein kinase [Pyrinomonadaceae bacterium]